MKTVLGSIIATFVLAAASTASAAEVWVPDNCRWDPPSADKARTITCVAPNGVNRVPVALPRGFDENTFEKAHSDDAAAMRLLGAFLVFTPWTIDSSENGVEWLTKAADAGDLLAMSYLAQVYFAGLDPDHGNSDAERLLRAAADKGLVTAKFNLGAIRLLNETETDDTEAADWFMAAAEAGSTDAMIVMGLIHARGLGVKKDEAEALRWLTRAADAGDTDAMITLGRFRAAGVGISKDARDSIRWFQAAADEDDPRGMLLLGLTLESGIGVPENPTAGAIWLRKAADRRLSEAMQVLSFLYAKGRGLPEDAAQSEFWRERAIAEGVEWQGYNDGILYADQMTEVIGRIESPLWDAAFTYP